MSLTKTQKAQLAIYQQELETANLPLSPELKEFYEKSVEYSIGQGTEYIEWIEEYKGWLLQRVFCCQLYGIKGREPSMLEMSRRLEGGDLLVSNVDTKYVGYSTFKYIVDDKDLPSDMHESGWCPSRIINTGKNHDWSCEYPALCINESEWLAKYPYCQWETYKDRRYNPSLFKFLCKYRANPKVELLIKAGYTNFIGCNMLNTQGKTFEEIFKVKQEFAKEYLKHGTRADLIILRNNPWINTIQKLNDFKYYIYETTDYTHKRTMTDDEIKYLCNVKNDKDRYSNLWYYRDYLNIAKELGYPLEQKKYHYPRSLTRAHDNAVKAKKVVANKKNNVSIEKLSKACQGFTYEKDGYKIFPLTCAEDLINESKVLDHCVRTYPDRVARNECLILFVRKVGAIDTPFVTVELTKGRADGDLMHQFSRITQVHGYKNSSPDVETSRFLMDWRDKFNLSGWSTRELAQA